MAGLDPFRSGSWVSRPLLAQAARLFPSASGNAVGSLISLVWSSPKHQEAGTESVTRCLIRVIVREIVLKLNLEPEHFRAGTF